MKRDTISVKILEQESIFGSTIDVDKINEQIAFVKNKDNYDYEWISFHVDTGIWFIGGAFVIGIRYLTDKEQKLKDELPDRKKLYEELKKEFEPKKAGEKDKEKCQK